MVARGDVWHDQFPWSRAQAQLATLLAKQHLGERTSHDEREATKRFFLSLGAPFFAGLVDPKDKSSLETNTSGTGVGILSRRERDVARLIAEGCTNRDIAEKLVLSERTVEGHVANIFNKLSVGARSQVAVWYVANAPVSTSR